MTEGTYWFKIGVVSSEEEKEEFSETTNDLTLNEITTNGVALFAPILWAKEIYVELKFQSTKELSLYDIEELLEGKIDGKVISIEHVEKVDKSVFLEALNHDILSVPSFCVI